MNFEKEISLNDLVADIERDEVVLEEPSIEDKEEIKEEIEEIKGTISNEHLWELGYDGEEPNPHTENIETLKEYLEMLEEKLKELKG